MSDPVSGIAVIAISAAVFFYLLYLTVNAAVLDALRKARKEDLIGPTTAANTTLSTEASDV